MSDSGCASAGLASVQAPAGPMERPFAAQRGPIGASQHRNLLGNANNKLFLFNKI